ncbi:hypothetical protein B0H15DRAFT_263749 [Mycena belliarum]|uniref:Uncharacterized protein n=1 Tax=Mycena belliarum TaxID=1033014 RepID=A0AAD6XVF0_9AGAR|nr:hypothetical protein B0H15DRAFT_263749 [Mycena belliae]
MCSHGSSRGCRTMSVRRCGALSAAAPAARVRCVFRPLLADLLTWSTYLLTQLLCCPTPAFLRRRVRARAIRASHPGSPPPPPSSVARHKCADSPAASVLPCDAVLRTPTPHPQVDAGSQYTRIAAPRSCSRASPWLDMRTWLGCDRERSCHVTAAQPQSRARAVRPRRVHIAHIEGQKLNKV